MAVVHFFAILLVAQSILWNAHVVHDELDEATRERMQLRAWYLSRKMTQMLQELEQGTQQLMQRTQEQSAFAWGALPFAALQQWQFWAVAGVLLLLFGLCWWLRKRSRQPASSSKEAGSGKKAAKEEQEVRPFTAADLGRILDKRFWELQQAFTMMDEMEEFYRISQRCEEKYHAAIAARQRCEQILGKLKSALQ